MNERIKRFYGERAMGGVGSIVVPGTPYGKASRRRPAISDKKHFAGWQELAEIVRNEGAKIFCQLHPTALQAGYTDKNPMPADLTLKHIRDIISYYVNGAVNALRIGLDGVEIHGAHAHEVAQFMSPYYNKRTDEYGKNTDGRSRFPREMVIAIKEKCGPDFPVIFRISGSEKIPGGREIEETKEIAVKLEEAGVDAFHVSVGMPESEKWTVAGMEVKEGFNVPSAEAIKKVVKVPVITVGRIIDPGMGEQIIQEGKADIVAMGRALLADPQLPQKYLSGDEPIRPCIGCNQGCRNPLIKDAFCLQNPRTGREHELTFMPTKAKKRIVVAGAGPGGMEAAVVLAERGHKVTLIEQNEVVGGLLNLAAVPPYKEPMKEVVTYRKQMLELLNVEVTTGMKVIPEVIKKINPSIVIVATGSSPLSPPIEGIDQAGVFTADQILGDQVEIKGSVAVIGGGLVGCETADYLAAKGNKVTIFESMAGIAIDNCSMDYGRRSFLMERLHYKGVDIYRQVEVLTVDFPWIKVRLNGKEETLGRFDGVVLAVGRTPNKELLEQLKELDVQTYVVGDAQEPALAIDAITRAAEIASEI